MAIKPILFSTPMVQAIKSNRKNQTRRSIKFPLKSKTHHISVGESYEPPHASFAPHQTGDILWVRETWIQIHTDFEFKGRVSEFVYRADEKQNEEKFGDIKNGVGKRFIDSWKWKPSIFMPKEACRLFLKVTGVRAERLQDITEDDAIAEGIEIKETCNGDDYSSYPRNYLLTEKQADGWPYCKEEQFVESYKTLWQSINGMDSWGANPWVWVYEFERIEKPDSWPYSIDINTLKGGANG